MAERRHSQMSFKDTNGKPSIAAAKCYCDPCNVGDTWETAEGYCEECKEYMCRKCLEVHKRQRLTGGHAILSKDKMPPATESDRNPDLCVVICEKHHPEIIRFYCPIHDVTGCGDCMTLDHATCKKERIPTVSSGFKDSKELQQMNQRLHSLQEQINTITGELRDSINTAEESYDSIIKEIEGFRKRMNDYLDEVEEQIKDEARNMKEKDKVGWNKLLTENMSMLSELKRLLPTIQSDGERNVNTIFINTKVAKRKLISMQNEINKFKQTPRHNIQYEFASSSTVRNIFSSKLPLGKLSRKFIKIAENSEENISQDRVKTPSSYVHVKAHGERKKCWISDCDILRPDRLVVVDGKNEIIQLIDISTNTSLCSHKLPAASNPFGVTVMDLDRVAVTSPIKNEIVIFKITSNFKKHLEIKVSGEPWGIDYKDGKFAVSYFRQGRVKILDIQGNVLNIIRPKQGDEDFLHSPFYVSFGNNENTVIVSDRESNRVSVITFRAKILQTFSHEALKGPTGFVVTPEGVMYVCSAYNGCIHRVAPDFKTSEVIIKTDGPQGITYCDFDHRLCISSHTGVAVEDNRVKLYDL